MELNNWLLFQEQYIKVETCKSFWEDRQEENVFLYKNEVQEVKTSP